MAVIVLPLFSVGIFLYQAHAQFPVHILNIPLLNMPAAGNISPGAEQLSLAAEIGAKPDAYLPPRASMLEIHVANNGLVLLRGARVSSVEGDIIRAHTAWDSAEFVWQVQTNKLSTTFLTSDGKKETLTDVRAGDVITVTGQLIRGLAEPMIEARFVRK